MIVIPVGELKGYDSDELFNSDDDCCTVSASHTGSQCHTSHRRMNSITLAEDHRLFTRCPFCHPGNDCPDITGPNADKNTNC